VLHLFHPALVHFTIAFLGVGGLVEAIGILAGREKAERAGTLMSLIGTASLLPTVIAIDVAAPASPWLDRHERFGIILLGACLGLLVTRAWGRGKIPTEIRNLYAIGLLLAVALMTVTAFLGGMLVYSFGVGTHGS